MGITVWVRYFPRLGDRILSSRLLVSCGILTNLHRVSVTSTAGSPACLQGRVQLSSSMRTSRRSLRTMPCSRSYSTPTNRCSNQSVPRLWHRQFASWQSGLNQHSSATPGPALPSSYRREGEEIVNLNTLLQNRIYRIDSLACSVFYVLGPLSLMQVILSDTCLSDFQSIE